MPSGSFFNDVNGVATRPARNDRCYPAP